MESGTPLPRYQGKEIFLIGISGKISSGKTTLAREILKRHPNFQTASFAENLRRMVSILIGIPVEKTRSIVDKAVHLDKWGLTVGDLLQRFGTEVGREIHPDAWVLSSFANFSPGIDRRIYDDVRFENEANAIKEHGGLMIRLEGDPGKCYEEASKSRNMQHASETALDNYEGFDLVINTDNYVDAVEALYRFIFDATAGDDTKTSSL